MGDSKKQGNSKKNEKSLNFYTKSFLRLSKNIVKTILQHLNNLFKFTKSVKKMIY